MELEEAKKLLKEMQENCKNKTIYKDEKAEAKAEAIEVILNLTEKNKQKNKELKNFNHMLLKENNRLLMENIKMFD